MTVNWYEYPFNYSNGTAVEGFGSWIQYTSLAVGDWFATGFILLIWLATFGVSLVAGSRIAMMVASFISFIFVDLLSKRTCLKTLRRFHHRDFWEILK